MNIHINQYIEKANRLQEGEVEFVVSTNALDAHGERIDVDGIDFKDFKKNPVVLWGHDGFNLPIAKATKIWKEGGKLLARAKFYMKDEFARKVYDYIVDGYLNAVSIGGMVEEWAEDGLTITKLNMKEFSVVTIPANQEALVSSKTLDKEQKQELNTLAQTYARKVITKQMGKTELQESAENLLKLATTLTEIATGLPDSETQEERSNNFHVVLRQAQAVDNQVEKVIKVVKKERSITK